MVFYLTPGASAKTDRLWVTWNALPLLRAEKWLSLTKNSAVNTLMRLKTMRNRLNEGEPNKGKMINELIITAR